MDYLRQKLKFRKHIVVLYINNSHVNYKEDSYTTLALRFFAKRKRYIYNIKYISHMSIIRLYFYNLYIILILLPSLPTRSII